MAGSKYGLDDGVNSFSPTSPIMSIFETFRSELDEHHDRRDRVIKASRDITALSKKMVRNLRQPLPPNIVNVISPYQTQIRDLFLGISPDLQQSNAHRYQRQISSGIQEYIEAISFQQYIQTQRLLELDQAQNLIPGGVLLTEPDYLMGIFDMIGELMRFAIIGMATGGLVSGSMNKFEEDQNGRGQDILTDMRALRMDLERLDLQGSGMKRDVERKMEVMQNCVEKVEKASYGLKIRGQEKPKGWIPDLTTD